MSISGTKLRENVYRVLDEVLESGKPVEIRRKGRTLQIVPDRPGSRLDRLRKRPTLRVKPDAIVHVDWSSEWRP
ncbi:MAG TPA: hypothetical protein VJ952_03720 [Opitutales bacterium]|nr:hypothetical protein [Opitutales bacterium]